jgi:environmental stress-induced protein Ves
LPWKHGGSSLKIGCYPQDYAARAASPVFWKVGRLR